MYRWISRPGPVADPWQVIPGPVPRLPGERQPYRTEANLEPTTSPPPTIRSVAMPGEHGGWSLTIEPALMGLLAAPSKAGVMLGVAALGLFLARTPLRVVLVDRYRDRYLPRTSLAGRILGLEAAVIGGLVVAAGVVGDRRFWWVAVVAIPLGSIGLVFDTRSRSRHLVAEMVATVAIAGVAAAIPLASSGVDWRIAVGLWVVAAARAVGTIPFVRLQLRRVKDQEWSRWGSDFAQLVAMDLVVLAWAMDLLTPPGAVAIVALGVTHLILSRMEAPPVGVIGAQQVVLGLGIVVAAGLGAVAPR